MPLWLAPVQVQVLAVSPEVGGDADDLVAALVDLGVRAAGDLDGSLGSRIRVARERRARYVAVLGAAEVAAATVDVLDPVTGERTTRVQEAFVADLTAAIAARHARLT